MIWPELASKCADDLCVVRSLHTDAINHDPAHTFMNTGSMIAGRPAMGSWLLYGLGNDARVAPRLCRDGLDRTFWPETADRRPAMALRLFAQPVSGGRVPQRGRPGALPQKAGGRVREAAASFVDAVNTLNRMEDAASPIPKSPRGSASTRWLSRCKRASRS